jgi:hypothetical protein
MLDVSPTSPGNRFRRARLGLLDGLIRAAVARRGNCTILDIGGTRAFWRTWQDLIDWRVVSITCLNLPGSGEEEEPGPVRMLHGDARAMPEFADRSFDICFSNSVIEHVGLWRDMADMAAEIRRIAPAYMVQTPNYWFPIEPHARTPFLHWLPEPLACRVVMARRCGFWARQHTVDGAMRTVQSARLLGPRQMAALFPDARIRRERFCALTKSLIALRRPPVAWAAR